MPSPSVTYSFSAATQIVASQVNQNFTDLVNGVGDGTKDLSISALTVAGVATFNGNCTFGNATGDDITFTGSLASSIPVKTTNTYNIGSSTLGLASIYFGANSQTVRLLPSASMSATWTLTLPVAAGTSGYLLKTDGSGVSSWQANTSAAMSDYSSAQGTAALSGGTTSPTVTVRCARFGDICVGMIEAFGSVTKSGAGSYALSAIIPSAYRPPADVYMMALCLVTGAYQSCGMLIRTSGNIDLYGDNALNNFGNGSTLSFGTTGFVWGLTA